MNPIDIKHDIFGIPLRRSQSEPITSDLQLGVAFALAGITALGNLSTPVALINSGFRGQRTFQGITYGAHTWDATYHYMTKASRAEQIGAKYGGRFGGIAMQSIGHMTPFVGWVPGHKMQLNSWIKKAGIKTGAKVGARVGGRLIPGLGWGLLAYDVYDIAVNQSLWGFDL